MTEIKHVSFDVWGTLFYPSLMFAMRRSQLLSEMFHLDERKVDEAYASTKQFVDEAAGTDGTAYTTDEVYAMMFDRLNLPVPLGPDALKQVRTHVEALFKAHPPMLDVMASSLFSFLKARDITMSIGSNSNFISGEMMFPFLQEKLNNSFAFGVFSDIEKVAKPNPKFFDRVVIEASKNRDVRRDEILHVGDSSACDGVGAINSGMQFAVIDNPNQLYAAIRSRFL